MLDPYIEMESLSFNCKETKNRRITKPIRAA